MLKENIIVLKKKTQTNMNILLYKTKSENHTLSQFQLCRRNDKFSKSNSKQNEDKSVFKAMQTLDKSFGSVFIVKRMVRN